MIDREEFEDVEDDDAEREPVQVFRDGKVHVRGACCGECLFSADRIVPGARARQIVASTRATDGDAFICHRSQVSDEPEAVCRGWFDRFAAEDWIFRLAIATGVVEFVGPETGLGRGETSLSRLNRPLQDVAVGEVVQ